MVGHFAISLCQALTKGCLDAKVLSKSSKLMSFTWCFSVERNVLVSWYCPQFVCVCHSLLLEIPLLSKLRLRLRLVLCTLYSESLVKG